MKSKDFLPEIDHDIDEELECHHKYHKLADAFEEAGQCHIAQIYRDMACEEELHSKHLKYISDLLKNHPVDDLKIHEPTPINSPSPMVRQMEPINKPTTII